MNFNYRQMKLSETGMNKTTILYCNSYAKPEHNNDKHTLYPHLHKRQDVPRRT